MRIKKSEFTETLYTRISKTIDSLIINYCTENNQSKSEFVRDAVEHYINHLTAESNIQKVKEQLAEYRQDIIVDIKQMTEQYKADIRSES